MNLLQHHYSFRFGAALPSLLCAVLFWILLTPAGFGQKPADPEQWLKEAEAAYGAVTNYTAIFHKQQRVNGKLLPKETISIKFRRPFSLYMRWSEAPYKDSEVLYVKGQNHNRAKVHRGGLLGFITWNLDPKHPRLMSKNLHPLTATGLGYLVESVTSNVRRAAKAGELGFFERGEETAYGIQTRILEVVLPQDRSKGYDAYRLVINQNLANKMLIKIHIYDWDNQLFENYGYEDLTLGAMLTDADFVPDHPDYHF
jgi:hypothetical protein